MIKKEYSSPQMQVIELNYNVSLLNMSPGNVVNVDVVADPSEEVDAEGALSPILPDFFDF